MALAAMAEFLTTQTPVPGESISLNGETLVAIIVVSTLGSLISGASKFLREKGVITNPPV